MEWAYSELSLPHSRLFQSPMHSPLRESTQHIFIHVTKHVSFEFSMFQIFAVCFMGFDTICWNKPLLSLPNCYEVVAMVAPSGHYGYTIVVSCAGINIALLQWLPMFLDP